MSKSVIGQETIAQVLDWAYDKSVNGIGGIDSAEKLAASYIAKGGSAYQQANSLIRFQNTKAAASGFVSGLGGIMTLPLTLPANITTVLFIQIRMIAALAHIGGHDVRSDQVKTMIYAYLVGNGAKDIVKNVGVSVGNRLAMNAVNKIPGKVLLDINKMVGFRLVTKLGQKGAVNFGKAVPLVGGLIGGTFDAVTTNTIGKVARDIFIGDSPPP